MYLHVDLHWRKRREEMNHSFVSTVTGGLRGEMVTGSVRAWFFFQVCYNSDRQGRWKKRETERDEEQPLNQ